MTDSDKTPDNGESITTRRGVRSFVIRQGRMTEGQKKAYDRLWPVYGLTREQGVIDPREVFGREAWLNLEIGFGMGHSLAEMAEAAPEQDFIGVEVHAPGVGALLKEIDERGLENVRIYAIDANDVIDLCLPDASIDRVMVFFPDPWPKKRHHKRRIVQPAFLARCARALKPGGTLHIATDWANYAEHIDETLAASDLFTCRDRREHDGSAPLDRPRTKFEQRGLRHGHRIVDWIFASRQ